MNVWEALETCDLIRARRIYDAIQPDMDAGRLRNVNCQNLAEIDQVIAEREDDERD